MRLTDILCPERIKVPLAATTKSEAIEELIDLIDADGWLTDRAQALRAVWQREQIRSTGIGHELAIPHGKTSVVRDLVMAVGKSAAGIEFDSVDGEPVHLILLLLSPMEKTGLHIQALARISRLMSVTAVRQALLSAGTAAEMHWMLRQREDPTP